MQKKDEWFDTDLDRDGSQCHIYLGDTPTLQQYCTRLVTEPNALYLALPEQLFSLPGETQTTHVFGLVFL